MRAQITLHSSGLLPVVQLPGIAGATGEGGPGEVKLRCYLSRRHGGQGTCPEGQRGSWGSSGCDFKPWELQSQNLTVASLVGREKQMFGDEVKF